MATVGALALTAAVTGEAQAATCVSDRDGAWTSATTWSCAQVPEAGDTVIIDDADDVTAGAAHTVSALRLIEQAKLTLGDGASVTAGALDVAAGTIDGTGALRATASFAKTSTGAMTVRDSVDVTLDGAGSLHDGTICLNHADGGDPTLTLNAVLTIESSAQTFQGMVFNCGFGAATPLLRISGTGSLVDEHPGDTRIQSPYDNDGAIRAASGLLRMAGGTGGAISTGSFATAATTDTLQLTGATLTGSGARLTGPGTIDISANLAAGPGVAVDPGRLLVFASTLTLTGAGTYAPGTIVLDQGGVIQSTRDVTTTGALDARNGELRGNHTVRPASLVKTTSGQLKISEGADLVLDAASTIADGSICLTDNGGGDPSLRLDATLTIGAANNQPNVFACNSGANVPHVFISSTGALVSQRPGITSLASPIDNDGEIRAEAGELRATGGSTGVTTTGRYVAGAGATLLLAGSTVVGDGGEVTGAGIVDSQGALTAGDGADVDPGTLRVPAGTFEVTGAGEYNPGTIEMRGGVLDASRDTAPQLLDARVGSLQGAHTITPASISKTTSGTLQLRDGAQLVIAADTTLADGSICLVDNGGGDPELRIQATLTIPASNAQAAPITCNGGADVPHVKVTPTGTLRSLRAGDTTIGSPLDNDGVVRAEAGRLVVGGGTAGATSTGDYVAAQGHILRLAGATLLGSGGSLTGAGTIETFNGTVVGDGAGLDAGTMRVMGAGVLQVAGAGAYSPGTLILDNGTVNSARNGTADVLDARSGSLIGTQVFTPQTLTKATAGVLGVAGTAELVLTEPATVGAGTICVSEQADLRVRAPLTLPAGTTLSCGTPGDPHLFIEPGGSLVLPGTGVWGVATSTALAGGSLTIGDGQRAVFSRLAQTAGTTKVAAGGTLASPVTVAGGVLAGAGEIEGPVTNAGGTVRPGASPGTLTIDGSFTQQAGGTLAVEVDGTQPGTAFDRLVVSGAATLGGTVAVDRDPAFTPANGDVFAFLTAGSRTGTFASVTGGGLSGGRSLAIDHQPAGARLVVIAPGAPVNTAAPSVSGTPSAGSTLTCAPGEWTNAPELSFAWLRDGVTIAGATAATYVLSAADAGTTIACRVTATNGGGSSTATSAGLVVPSPPAPAEEEEKPDVVTTVTQPAPAPELPVRRDEAPAPTPQEQRLAAAKPGAVATALGLPSARRCASRRRFSIRIKQIRGVTVVRASVIVAGKRVPVRRVGGRLTATVDLRGLRRGRFTVVIRATTASGKTITGRRSYRACAPKRAKRNRGRL